MPTSLIHQDFIFVYGMWAALRNMLFRVGHSETLPPTFQSLPSGESTASTNWVNVPPAAFPLFCSQSSWHHSPSS